MKKLLYTIIFFYCFFPLQADDNEFESWFGYFLPIHLNEKFGVWNDFHYVPNTFFVSRHGIIYKPTKNITLAGGYAWVETATSFSDNIIRDEHRLWGQIETRYNITEKISYRFRFRSDQRFRQRIANSELQNDFILINRFRFANSFRYQLHRFDDENNLHLNLMHELLVNTGKTIEGIQLDQNRVFLHLGYSYKNFTLLSGYHLRLIPSLNEGIRQQHGFTFWLIHSLDFSK